MVTPTMRIPRVLRERARTRGTPTQTVDNPKFNGAPKDGWTTTQIAHPTRTIIGFVANDDAPRF